MTLWAIEQIGGLVGGGIIQADTAPEAIALWRDHLELYEGVYASTGHQRIAELPVKAGIVHVDLCQIGYDVEDGQWTRSDEERP